MVFFGSQSFVELFTWLLLLLQMLLLNSRHFVVICWFKVAKC